MAWKKKDLANKAEEQFCKVDTKCKLLEEQLLKPGEELKMAKKEREEHCWAKAEAEASLVVVKIAMFDLQAEISTEKRLR